MFDKLEAALTCYTIWIWLPIAFLCKLSENHVKTGQLGFTKKWTKTHTFEKKIKFLALDVNEKKKEEFCFHELLKFHSNLVLIQSYACRSSGAHDAMINEIQYVKKVFQFEIIFEFLLVFWCFFFAFG